MAVNVVKANVSGNQFSISGLGSPLSLPKGQSVGFQVWFDSTSTGGSANGTLTVQTDTGILSGQVVLTGNATTTTALQQISVNPASLNLGSATVGTTATVNVKITNAGGNNLILSSISATGPFGVSGITTPGTIAPGGSGILTVAFSPRTAGSDSGSVTITSNDPKTPTTIINLSGTGLSSQVPPTISTQPANETVATGQTASFTVVAGGTASLSYQWQKNGADIAGATMNSYTHCCPI